jgi:hypothetical protein
VNKNFQGDVSQQAALFLKLLVIQNWTLPGQNKAKNYSLSEDKENINAINA